MNYKKILISFSDKKHDMPVLRSGLDLAGKYDADVHILHINSTHAGYPSRIMRKFEHKYTADEIADIIAGVKPANVEPVIDVIQSSDLIGEVVERSKDYNLLVLGHQHMGFFESHLSDSNDEVIVDQIGCDALVVQRD